MPYALSGYVWANPNVSASIMLDGTMLSSLNPSNLIATYNAAKAALISLGKALSTELAPDRIGVNTVAPGSIRFPGGGWDRRVQADPAGMERFVKENIPGGRFGTADEVASVVAFLCSDHASWVTGACLVVDGGQSRSNI